MWYIPQSTVSSTNIFIVYWLCINICPKEWLNRSNEIDHPFQNKLKKAKNEAIEQVLEYHNHECKNNKLIKIGIEKRQISDDDCSIYSDATDPCYPRTEKELF